MKPETELEPEEEGERRRRRWNIGNLNEATPLGRRGRRNWSLVIGKSYLRPAYGITVSPIGQIRFALPNEAAANFETLFCQSRRILRWEAALIRILLLLLLLPTEISVGEQEDRRVTRNANAG